MKANNSNAKLYIVTFFHLFLVFYLITIFVFSEIRINGFTILQICTKNRLWAYPGGFGHSLKRFRNVETYKNVDVLFLGSSHAYRSFDPRIFLKDGLVTFNMGSPSQSPLNSYYLLKRYFDKLSPRIVIYEVYFKMFEIDGLESFYDLSTNLPFSKEIIEMAFAIKHPHAINKLLSTYLSRIKKPLKEEVQEILDGEKYIHGGYVESKMSLESIRSGSPHNIKIADTQMRYLKKIILFLKKKNCKIIFVTQPMPTEYVQSIKNYKIFSKKIDAFAESMDTSYYDFNKDMILDEIKYFKDYQHLNHYGVEQFNKALINALYCKMV